MSDPMTEALVRNLRATGIATAIDTLVLPDSHDAFPADTAFWILLRSLDRQALALGITMDYHRIAEAYKATRGPREARCPHGRSLMSRRDNPCPPGFAACRP